MTRTITGKIYAYLTEYGDPERLRGKDDEAITELTFCYSDDMETCGWTKVGKATVTVKLVDEKQIIENKVESLRTQKACVMAEATAQATEIERKIQNLLAISYDKATPSDTDFL